MLKKLINRSESSHVEMNDSVLRDIIPSNDLIIPEEPKQKRLSNICKTLILIFILGLFAIGIVALGLILAFSGKSFMNYIIHSTGDNSLSLSNKTYLPTILHQETAVGDEQNLKKITVIPTDNNQPVRIPIRMDEESILVTEENQMTAADTFTSTFFIPKIRDRPLTTEIILQSSTNQNKKIILAKYRKLEEDYTIDDLLYR